MAKTFAVKTLGCKVNQYESQFLRERLLSLGLKESEESPADVYVVNTCAVTQKADKESFDAIRQLNRSNPQAKIFVTGCSAQNNPERLKNLEGVAGVLENNEKENLPDFVLSDNESPRFPARKPRITQFHQHTRAFLKIQDGCNNGCSYCIIPKLRGSSRSRPLSEINQEARVLVNNGYKEIVLCGICLGDYGKDLGFSDGLLEVIEALEGIGGLLRLRLSSIEANDVTPGLINALVASRKLCHHLHIPFQSADDSILERMNRKANSGSYRRLVTNLYARIPDIGITTDIMVGFPGEEEENFNNSLKFLKEIRPHRVHVFPFSPRKGTPAFSFANTLDRQIIRERLRRIKNLAQELAYSACSSYLGQTLKVLIESGPGPKKGGQKGYSDNYLKVFIPRIEPITNNIVTVKAQKIYQDGILAEPV